MFLCYSCTIIILDLNVFELLCNFWTSWLVHGTVFLNSSPTAHLLAPLDISKPLIFAIILEHETAAYTNFVKRPCSSFSPPTTLCPVYITLGPIHYTLHCEIYEYASE